MAILSLTRELYFTTSTVVDWIDVFTRPVYKNIVVESLRYCQAQKGLDIYAWVLMTDFWVRLQLIISSPFIPGFIRLKPGMTVL